MRNPLDLARPDTSPRARPSVSPSCESLEARSLLSGVSTAFQVTQDWGSGFQASMSITNAQSSDVNNWQLEFDYPANITSIWDAKIVSHTGDHYVLQGAGWNNNLPAGGTVSFGFLGSPGNTSASPSNYRLNGAPLGSALPSLSIGDASALAPSSGSTLLNFPVKLSAASNTPVSVHYNTVDG